MLFVFRLVLSIVIAGSVASAQRWVRFDAPSGATFMHVAVSTEDPQIVVATIQSYALPIYTTDGGTTWKEFAKNPVEYATSTQWLGMVAGTRQTVRMIVNNELHETSNFGATYTKLSTLPSRSLMAFKVHPTDPNYWFTWGYGSAVVRSTNAGKTWDSTFASSQSGMTGPIMSPAAPNRIYVEVRDTIYESLDTGRTWQHFAPTKIMNYSLDLLAADVADGNRLYGYAQGRLALSTDRGRTWQDQTQRNMLGVRGISQSPLQPNVLWAWGTNLHRSVDRGVTWVTVDTIHTERMSAVLVNDQLTVGCYQSGIFRGSQDGRTWTRLDHGINRLDIRTIIPLSNREWYVHGVNDVFRTTDAGETFTTLTPVSYNQPSGGRVYSFGVAPSDPRRMLGGTNSDIYRSTDGGVTWQGSGQNEPINFISFHPHNPLEIVCGGLYNLKHSTDGGATWKNDVANSHHTLIGLARSFKVPSLLLAAHDDAVYSTRDSGITWTKHTWNNGTINVLIADLDDGNTFYAAGQRGLFVTTDVGSTWKSIGAFPYAIRAFVQNPADHDMFYLSWGMADLMRFRKSTGVLDTLYRRDFLNDRYSISQLAVVGNTILAAAAGLLWFDPTPVSVKESASTLDQLTLYPNPVAHKLHIILPDQGATAYVAEVIDITGRQLLSVPLVGNGDDGRYAIDVSGLPSGIMALRVTSATASRMAVFVKQ
jgi:photosystem II stability/assembly factor-like uncharacterized protein